MPGKNYENLYLVFIIAQVVKKHKMQGEERNEIHNIFKQRQMYGMENKCTARNIICFVI